MVSEQTVFSPDTGRRYRVLVGAELVAGLARHLDDLGFPASRIVVSSPRVSAPKAVRLGWSQLAVPNLANKEGLPASPFRTDRW